MSVRLCQLTAPVWISVNLDKNTVSISKRAQWKLSGAILWKKKNTGCNAFYTRVSHNVVTMETSAIGWPPRLIVLWYISVDLEESWLVLIEEHEQWGLCTLRHGIQISMEAILACNPARSTEWLDCHPKSCELWNICTGPIVQISKVSKCYQSRWPSNSTSFHSHHITGKESIRTAYFGLFVYFLHLSNEERGLLLCG